jgi:glycine cleavage system aminomethyltransferase T
MRFVVEGRPLEYVEGDSVAVAMLRNGEQPAHGGTLCLSGDCGNCVAIIDGVAYSRTCQVTTRAGMVIERHPLVGGPSMFRSQPTLVPVGGSFGESQTAADVPRRNSEHVDVSHEHCDVAVIGFGSSGQRAAAESAAVGREVLVLDAGDGNEVVAIYAGPIVIVRSLAGMRHIHAHEVVIATGAAELQPVCEGNTLAGILTPCAASTLRDAGLDLGRVVCVGAEAGTQVGDRAVPSDTVLDGLLVRFNGTTRVESVTVRGPDGIERDHPCDTVIAALGSSPRDVLSRMNAQDRLTVVGSASSAHDLPLCPTSGVVCPCSKTTIEDLDGAWQRGFNEVELLKRATLCGTGTCQGAACVPHLRAFVAQRTGEEALPFTARPAARQITMGEALAGVYLDTWRRTALHDEHLKLGAQMDRFGGWWRPWNYGNHVEEYWAVREAVSIGDVSTLGKMIVTGPDSVELLERLYPTTVADIKPGRSRYVLLLNERGHLIDDGMIVRENETRFVLSFTSGGATNAEMWIRDWIETWNLDVRLMDRTTALGAINVTGPLGGELLRRLGVDEPPKFLQHRHGSVGGVPCHIMRLSFTGEASWELHHPIDRSVELWRQLLSAGADLGIKAHGLQALFGLRLEKGHVIVGMDTELDTTPRRIDHDWAVKTGKPFFLGQDALRRTANLADHRRLLAFSMDGAAPIEGCPIWIGDQVAGHVTTSFTSPVLRQAVMLGWLKRGFIPGEEMPKTVIIDGRVATVSETPFYDKEGARARA